MKGKLTKLESMRGFAAVYVVLSHLFDTHCMIGGQSFTFLFKFGQEAVIIFFILSGFVIHYSFAKSKDKSFSTFFQKRFYRIYIPLIIVFITSYILYVLYSAPLGIIIWQNLLGNLFMSQDLYFMKPNVISEPFLRNGPLWSLSYEWWFYMLYFFIEKYWSKRGFVIVSALAVISTVTYIFYPFFLNRLLMYLIIWWAGVEMAKLYSNKAAISLRSIRPILIVILGCATILFGNWLFVHQEIQLTWYPFVEFRHMFFAFLVIALAIGWKNCSWIYFDQTFGLFTFMAPISYTIYISHFFLVINPDYSNSIGNKTIQTIIGILICLAFSFVVELQVYPYLMTKIGSFKERKS